MDNRFRRWIYAEPEAHSFMISHFRLSVGSFVYLFVRLFAHSFIPSFPPSLLNSFIHSVTNSFVFSLISSTCSIYLNVSIFSADEISSQSGSRSASSEYIDSSFRRYAASHGVINYQGVTGGWKPSQNSINEYLEVDIPMSSPTNGFSL